MGTRFLDQYSLLHTAVGVIAYFWGLSAWHFFLLHALFELLENTPTGMALINQYLPFWPGGKPYADTLQNSIGDNLAAMAGWGLAYALDSWGSAAGWYMRHLA